MCFTSYAFMFHIKKYQMDLRSYLTKHRDYRKLNEILLQVVAGLKELHGLGFVHRDLKPENIVLDNGHPIKVALIDFDRSLPITCTSKTGTRGTPGY
jgi:serine/threonine protein kinase